MWTVEDLAAEILLYHRGPEFKLASLDSQNLSALEAGSRVLDADVSEVETMVRRDPAMLADLLKLANSPTYRRVGVPMNLADIIVRLGRREVYNVVMSSALRNLTRRALGEMYKVFPDRWQTVHRHFLTCAFTSGWLADKERWVGYDNGFMAGMFHDIGRLVALQIIAALVLRKKISAETDAPLFDPASEQTYVLLGSSSLRAWNMPAYIIKVWRQPGRATAGGQQHQQVGARSALDLSVGRAAPRPGRLAGGRRQTLCREPRGPALERATPR